MNTPLSPFKWRHFEGKLIPLCVRWYLRYALGYRDVEELARERGLSVDHITVFRWVQRYAPELDRRCRPPLRASTDSYRVDETDIKIKKQWHYLYRTVDSTVRHMGSMLSATRDAEAAERFFRKALAARHTAVPRVITVDRHAAYPPAFAALQQERILPAICLIRHCKYLNNVIERDPRFMKRRVNPGLGRFPRRSGPSRTMQPCTCST